MHAIWISIRRDKSKSLNMSVFYLSIFFLIHLDKFHVSSKFRIINFQTKPIKNYFK